MLIVIILLISVSLLIYIKFRNFSFKYSLNYFIIHIRFLEERYKYCRFLCCCSVANLFPTLCSPMDCSTPGLPVLHRLPKFVQTHLHRVGDATQPSHPLSSPSPPAPHPSQHQGLFQRINSSTRWPKYWSFSLSISPSNEHTALISFRMYCLDLCAVQGTLKSLLQHHSSKASILWCSAFFMVQFTHSSIFIIIFIITGLLDNSLSALLQAHAAFTLGLLANLMENIWNICESFSHVTLQY